MWGCKILSVSEPKETSGGFTLLPEMRPKLKLPTTWGTGVCPGSERGIGRMTNCGKTLIESDLDSEVILLTSMCVLSCKLNYMSKFLGWTWLTTPPSVLDLLDLSGWTITNFGLGRLCVMTTCERWKLESCSHFQIYTETKTLNHHIVYQSETSPSSPVPPCSQTRLLQHWPPLPTV